jgi:molybdopterin-dependent oxidoreductase alpha subunit
VPQLQDSAEGREADLEPRAEAPPEVGQGTVGPRGETAAGPKGIRAALKHVAQETGLVRGLRTLSRVNQHGGFDCPGCAWPDPAHRSLLGEYCENGAKAVADEATTRRADPAFFAAHSVRALSERPDRWLNRQGRITEPMLLDAGATHYRPVSWDEAFALVARELNALASPDDAVFYTSGRTSNEAAFLYQLFVRAFGTNNLPDCSNLCHESSGRGLSEVIGVGKGTVLLEDFEEADVILVIGQNPGTNHPRMLTTLEAAKRRGATLVHINPLPETGMARFKHPQTMRGWLGAGTPLTDQFLQVRINGDVALLQGVMKHLLERDAVDRGFVEAHTSGFDGFARDLRARSFEELEAGSGVDRAAMGELADRLSGTSKIIACWAMGLTQHENGVANVQSVVNLLLLRGALGRPGAGVCPVRGHSNVQGDRTMGITERPRPAFLDALGERFGFAPPRAWGYDVVDAIGAMARQPGMVFFAMGGNFLSASPDTARTAEALRRCRLTAHVSTKLNRSHLVHGRRALVLPVLGRTERDVQGGEAQFVTVENSMGVVHRSVGRNRPASDALVSEPRLVARLAEATLAGRGLRIPWSALADDYARIRDAIEACVPGFEDFASRVEEPGGFALHNPARERDWRTSTGRAQFTVHPVPDLSLPEGRLHLATVRSHDQYNTTIYGHDDRYRGVKDERRVVFLHPEDIAARGLEDGQIVDLVSHWKDGERVAERFRVTAYDIPRGNAAAYFPEANPLVPLGQTARGSNTPASKSVVISLRPRS